MMQQLQRAPRTSPLGIMPEGVKLRLKASSLKCNLDVSAWKRNGCPVPPPFGYKMQVLRKYAEQYQIDQMIETGTYQGQMDFALKDVFSHIATIELSPELHAAAKKQLAAYPQIECLLGDSAALFPALLKKLTRPCLFWLDAHYSAGPTAKAALETPISAELNAVLEHSVRKHVILIDDARNFDGTHDYPHLAELQDNVLRKRPDLSFEVDYDIIRITPK
jgi:hypothetical protein